MGANESLICPEEYWLAANLGSGLYLFSFPWRDSTTLIIKDYMLCSWQGEGVETCSTPHDQLTPVSCVGKGVLWLLNKTLVTRKTYGTSPGQKGFHWLDVRSPNFVTTLAKLGLKHELIKKLLV